MAHTRVMFRAKTPVNMITNKAKIIIQYNDVTKFEYFVPVTNERVVDLGVDVFKSNIRSIVVENLNKNVGDDPKINWSKIANEKQIMLSANDIEKFKVALDYIAYTCKAFDITMEDKAKMKVYIFDKMRDEGYFNDLRA